MPGATGGPGGPGGPPPQEPQENEVAPDVAAGMPNVPAHMQKIALSITYKDAPPHIQRQIEKAAGFDTQGLPDEQKPPVPTAPIPAAPTAGTTTSPTPSPGV
jgi:hypothetical protein